MNSIFQEQQYTKEESFDLRPNIPNCQISAYFDQNKVDIKIQDLQTNIFLKNKNISTNEDNFQRTIIPNNISTLSNQKIFCQTLLDNNTRLQSKSPIDTLPQSKLNRISHLFQNSNSNNQKDFCVKEISDGFLQHQSGILHYHSKSNQNSTKKDNDNIFKTNVEEHDINLIKAHNNIKANIEDNDTQQTQLTKYLKEKEDIKDIENFYKEKYLQTKEKYKKAKQIIASLQKKISKKSLRDQETQKEDNQTKIIQNQKTEISSESKQNICINNTNSDQIIKIKKKYQLLKEEFKKSKVTIENQNKQIFQLQNIISKLLLNSKNSNNDNNTKNQNTNIENKKTVNEHYIIAKKAHLCLKGKIKSRSKSLSNRSLSPVATYELTPHPINQYRYLCNMLNVKSDEFNQQWDKVFRKIADLLNTITALKQHKKKPSELDLLKKQYDDISRRFNISRLSSRFGTLISNFNSNFYKEIEDLHSTITKKKHSHFREIILAVIFTNRMLNIIKFESFINEKSLTVFAERPFYSPEVLIGEIRSNFTTISQDLVYSQNEIRRKTTKS